MAKDITASFAALRTAAKGLTFTSEADKPIKAFTWTDEVTGGAKTAEEAVQHVTGASKDKITTVPAAEFFTPMSEDLDWYGEGEKKIAARFRALVKALADTLDTPTAYRVKNDSTVDVYVVGKDKGGQFSGVSTQLIET